MMQNVGISVAINKVQKCFWGVHGMYNATLKQKVLVPLIFPIVDALRCVALSVRVLSLRAYGQLMLVCEAPLSSLMLWACSNSR